MNKLYLLLCIMLIVPATALASFNSFGDSVTLTLEFLPFGSADYLNNDSYVIVSNTTALALIQAGNDFYGTFLDQLHTTFQARQPPDSRFIVAFTNANISSIQKKIANIKGGILYNQFGNLNFQKPSQFHITLRLNYKDINITNSDSWTYGPKEILIENNGKDADGRTLLHIEVNRH